MHEPLQTDGRRLHYGEFYGLLPVRSDAQLAVVVGNCQAESLRIMLDGPDLCTVRIPPVFELTADDLPYLSRLLARTRVLVSQPIRDDYHDLPLGTAQLAGLLPRCGRVVRVPVVRFAGLYPFQAIVRPPFDASLVPPLVEYHDLRTVARVLRGSGGYAEPGRFGVPGGPGGFGGPAGPDGFAAAPDAAVSRGDAASAVERIRAISAQSIAELQKRERHHGTVIVSDLFSRPNFDLMRTINHPGNTVWAAAAARVRARLGLAEHLVDPGRELLNAVHAPREPLVIEAFGLDTEPRAEWIVGERILGAAEVEHAHLRWYAEHPSVIDAAVVRHTAALQTLGLLEAMTPGPGRSALGSARALRASAVPGTALAASTSGTGTGTTPSAETPSTAATGAIGAGTIAAVAGTTTTATATGAIGAIGAAALPRQLVLGSTRHAVTSYADALARSTSRHPPSAAADAALRVPDVGGLVDSATGIQCLHVQFTDRLFGPTPEAAAALFEALAKGRRVTVTLHDLPQPSDGERNLPRRAAAYARVADAASGVVCNSRHEALLLAEHTRPRSGREVAVIPLPVEPASSPGGTMSPGGTVSRATRSQAPMRREAAILGYFYPGKGHAEVIAAVAERAATLAGHGAEHRSTELGDRAPELTVTALGAAAPGHELELAETAAAASALGVVFEATGYLGAADLLERCRSAAVPVAAHQHLSASASINTWIAAGRRPLLPAGRYTREMCGLRPATVTLYEPGHLSDALDYALSHPESTWLEPGTSIRPDLDDTAERYLEWWGTL